jgi:prepilin-type processing-associated H-X9-DG protein
LSIGTELYSVNHFLGGNLLFCDGHAEFRKALKLRSEDFGLNPSNHTQTAQSNLPYTPAF